ncbi:chorismate mutase [Candidatus Magnetaquiglobus chichijimensis]|uniref:chorismate mutase n=1 Tax=Candidatus Magnetaquiglobus chichijimensis TaxID=3141448 RepID=UPI003B97B06B
MATATPPSSEQQALLALREAIDAIDDRIHDLLMERIERVLEVGHLKSVQGNVSPDPSFYRPEREASIHRRLEARHRGPLPKAALHRIYREIISASLSLEKRLTVAYLGPEHAFAHLAALKQFGSSCHLRPTVSIDELFHEVEVNRADFGVAPVENSNEGMISHTLDRFVDSPLSIRGEIYVEVSYAVFSGVGSTGAVRLLLGTRLAMTRCRGWIERHMPGAPQRVVESMAEALRVAREESGVAIVAPMALAEVLGCEILAEHIEDRAEEIRFLVIGRGEPTRSGRDKTSLMFTFRDQPGFLHQVLGIFAKRQINLTRIESRPSGRQAWEYLFFLDLSGHLGDPPVAGAMEELAQMPGVTARILGSYPVRAL